MKRIRLSIIHVAVIAAITTVAPVEAAKNILEGQSLELQESVYKGDVIGGQYIHAYKPSDGTYFGPSNKPLYEELKDLDSTSIFLGKKQQITEELIGGTYLHGGTTTHEAETKFGIGSVNIDVRGGSVGQNIFGGNKFNTNATATFNATIDEVTIKVRDGAKVTGAVYAGSSMKSQLNSGVSNIQDHIKKATITVSDSEVSGVVAGSFMQSVAGGEPHVSSLIDESLVVISGATVNKLSYDGMNGDQVVPEYSMNVSGSVYGGGLVLNGNNGKSFVNKVGKSEIRIQDGSDIKGHVIAGGLVFLGKEAQEEGTMSETEVADVKVIVSDSKVSGDVILGSHVVHQFSGTPLNFSSKLGSTELSLHNATIDGTIRGQDLIVNGSAADQDVLNYQSNNAKKALTLSGTNVINGISDVPNITLNATKENVGDQAKAVLTIKNSADLQDAVITVNAGDDIGSKNVLLMALEDGATVTGNNTKIVGKGVFVDQVWQAQDQADLEALFNEGTVGSQALDFAPTLNANAETLSDVRLGTLAFINQGSEFIADEGLASMRRAATVNGTAAFAAMHGGWSEYSTGADVELQGVAFVLGAATQVNDFTLGAFVEGGSGSSDVGQGVAKADGDHSYYGVGMGGVWTPDDHWHIDGALRLGQGSTEFSGLLEGNSAKYDSDAFYASLHVGAGYKWMLTQNIYADVYARYALGYIDGDDLTMEDADHSRLHMDEAWTHTVRLGTRFGGQLANNTLQWAAGLAYEHVFDGDSDSTVQDVALRTPSLEGDSGIVEFKFGQNALQAGDWGWNFGVKGYLGDRQGVISEANIQYAF